MRKAQKVNRDIVKAFIQKDKTITCPIKGDYYALIGDNGEILSALCVTDQREKLGYFRIQGMRTAKENRGKGYSTELLRYALSHYEGIVHADAMTMSKGIFNKLGFKLLEVDESGNHIEYRMERVNNGKEDGETTN